MAFDFNWAPQKLPLQMINGRARAAADNMAGYVPNEGNPEILGNEILTENAVDNMKGYNPNLQEQRYVGRTPQQFSNAGQGQGYTFNDPEFTQYMQEQQQAEQEAARIEQQAAQREKRISDIQSQIAELEKRIADNTSKLQNFTGSADQIAAIEARKINSQDPTMIWRWKVGQDEARRIAKQEKEQSKTLASANAMYEIQNDLDSIVVDDKMDSTTQKAYLSKLANLKTLAQKNKLPTDSIDAKIKEVKGETETSVRKGPEGSEYEGTSREQWDNEATELLSKPDLTQGDIMKFKQKNPNISNEVRQKLEAKHSELIEADKKKAYEKGWQAYLDDYVKKNGAVSDKVKATLRRLYDKRNKKG